MQKKQPDHPIGLFFIVICLVCLVYKEDSNTVPVVFCIRLFGVTLPVDSDAVAVDAIVVGQCIGNGSCTFSESAKLYSGVPV